MAKRKQARRKREPTMRTHAQWLQIAHWAEANGDKDKAEFMAVRFRSTASIGGSSGRGG